MPGAPVWSFPHPKLHLLQLHNHEVVTACPSVICSQKQLQSSQKSLDVSKERSTPILFEFISSYPLWPDQVPEIVLHGCSNSPAASWVHVWRKLPPAMSNCPQASTSPSPSLSPRTACSLQPFGVLASFHQRLPDFQKTWV